MALLSFDIFAGPFNSDPQIAALGVSKTFAAAPEASAEASTAHGAFPGNLANILVGGGNPESQVILTGLDPNLTVDRLGLSKLTAASTPNPPFLSSNIGDNPAVAAAAGPLFNELTGGTAARMQALEAQIAQQNAQIAALSGGNNNLGNTASNDPMAMFGLGNSNSTFNSGQDINAFLASIGGISSGGTSRGAVSSTGQVTQGLSFQPNGFSSSSSSSDSLINAILGGGQASQSNTTFGGFDTNSIFNQTGSSNSNQLSQVVQQLVISNQQLQQQNAVLTRALSQMGGGNMTIR